MLETIVVLSVLLALSLAGLIVRQVQVARYRREIARLRDVARRKGKALSVAAKAMVEEILAESRPAVKSRWKRS